MTAARFEIGIRDVTDADLPFVLSLLNREIAQSPYVYAEVPVTLDERRAWLATHRGAGLPVLLAVHDDAPVGWASLSPYRASSGYRHTVEASVYVAPDVQRRGVASRLLDALEMEAARSDKHVIIASIDAGNAASIALFERRGYSEVARLPEVGRKFGAWRTQILLSKVLADHLR